VLISSNRPVEEWDEVFGDQVVAAAILDWLLHHSHVVTIRGDSYRLREKRRSGLFRPQTGGPSLAGIGGVPPPTPAKEALGGTATTAPTAATTDDHQRNPSPNP
jgi:hypothetical protein